MHTSPPVSCCRDPDKHPEMRSLVVTELVLNRHRYDDAILGTHTAIDWPKHLGKKDLPLYRNGHYYEAYVQHMGRLGTWGDEAALRAALNVIRASVTIVSTLHRGLDMELQPHFSVPVEEHLVLVHVQDLHYDGVRPLRKKQR